MTSELPPIDALLADGASVMWVAAHPDDEFLSGALLARASIHYGNRVAFVILTHGEGGESAIPIPEGSDLGDVRRSEMESAAEAYRADLLRMERFWNAPLPMSSFPPRHELWARWLEDGDPLEVVKEEILRFRPDIVLAFEPTRGATGHPEHQLASRVAMSAVREAAGDHRVTASYYLLSRHPFFRVFGKADPGPVTEIWDTRLPCGDHGSCLDFGAEQALFHRTQAKDMAAFRRFRRLFHPYRLRRIDPLTDALAPDEPV